MIAILNKEYETVGLFKQFYKQTFYPRVNGDEGDPKRYTMIGSSLKIKQKIRWIFNWI